MKNIIRYIACGLSAFLMTACGDMYEIHEKYLEMGEETYLGAVQDLSAYSGFNRVKLEWYLNADPRISSCVITWSPFRLHKSCGSSCSGESCYKGSYIDDY